MIYKIIGQTGSGRCSCGHRVRVGEEYYIFTSKTHFNSNCKICAKEPKGYSIVKIPDDLHDDVIHII